MAVFAQVAGAEGSAPVDTAEGIAVVDAVAVDPPVALHGDETASVSDAVGIFPAAAIDEASAVGVADAVTVTPPTSIAGDETARVADSVGVFPAAAVPAEEPVQIGDEVAVMPSPIVSAAEALHVGDSVTVTPSAMIATDQSVGVVDAVSVVPAPLVTGLERIAVGDEAIVEPLLAATETSVAVGSDPVLLGRDELITVAVRSGAVPATTGFVVARESGTAVAGPVAVGADGTAMLVVHGLGVGTHVLNVEFGGTPLFSPSHATASIHVYDYALSAAPSQVTIQRGGSTDITVTATLAPGSTTGASTAPLDFTFSNAPAGVTGSFAGAIRLPGLGTASLTVSALASARVGASTLTVSSDNGARSVAVRLFVNAPPVPTGGTYADSEGSALVLHASAADLDLDTISYAWDLNADGTFETTGQDASFTPADGPAVLHPRVRACDAHDACAVSSATVSVANVPPTARITSPSGGEILVAGAPVRFTGSFTDPGALDTHAVRWSFGATSLNPTSTFTTAGLQTVTLTVTDNDGGIGTASVDVVVVNTRSAVAGAGFFGASSARVAFVFVAGYVGATPAGLAAVTTPVGTLYSTSYRYLAVAGSTFDLDGVGTFNGTRNVPFHLSGTSGRIRVRIGSVYDSGGPIALLSGAILIRP